MFASSRRRLDTSCTWTISSLQPSCSMQFVRRGIQLVEQHGWGEGCRLLLTTSRQRRATSPVSTQFERSSRETGCFLNTQAMISQRTHGMTAGSATFSPTAIHQSSQSYIITRRDNRAGSRSMLPNVLWITTST